jgi:fused signal recognition particle receptor
MSSYCALFNSSSSAKTSPFATTISVPGTEPKRGFFDRMKQAVTRTRESFSESISSVIALTREIDEPHSTNLKPSCSPQTSAATTSEIIENLKQRALRTGYRWRR